MSDNKVTKKVQSLDKLSLKVIELWRMLDKPILTSMPERRKETAFNEAVNKKLLGLGLNG